MIDQAFAGRLLGGERILWQGQPSQGILFIPRDMFVVPFGLLWCGFAIFWTIGASRASGGGPFPLFGLLFVCIGLYFVFGRFLVDAWARTSMHYAVTDRRILIIRSRPTSSFTALRASCR